MGPDNYVAKIKKGSEDMTEQKRGVWIAFEGNDYAGKSEQSKRFAEYLTHDLGLGPVIETREPGGYWLAEKIRELILDPEIAQDPETQLLLFTAARRRNIIRTVWPAVGAGAIVLSDRSEGSTFAYQHFQSGLSFKTVDFINDFATDGRKPDLSVLLDITEQEAFFRRDKRSGAKSTFDTSNYADFKARRMGYLKLAKNPEKYGLNPWVVIDANKDKDGVFDDIVQAIKKTKLIPGL